MQAFGDGQTYSHGNLNKLFVKKIIPLLCFVLHIGKNTPFPSNVFKTC